MSAAEPERSAGAGGAARGTAVQRHIQRYLGELSQSAEAEACKAAFARELAQLKQQPEYALLDTDVSVELVEPNIDRTSYTLVTHGVSRRPLNVPPALLKANPESLRYVELVICLPYDWPLTAEALTEQEHVWPLQLLARVAQYPHARGTWIAEGHTLGGDIDHAEAYAPNTQLCCAVVSPLFEVDEGFRRLKAQAGQRDSEGGYVPGKSVNFIGLIPIYAEEMRVAVERGGAELLDLLETCGVTEELDPARKCAVRKKRFWFF